MRIRSTWVVAILILFVCPVVRAEIPLDVWDKIFSYLSKEKRRETREISKKFLHLFDERGSFRFLDHRNAVFVRFSPDNQYILTASIDHLFKVWTKNGELVSSFYRISPDVLNEKHWTDYVGSVNSVEFTTDSKSIFIGANGFYELRDLQGTLLFKSDNEVYCSAQHFLGYPVQVSPDQSHLLVLGRSGWARIQSGDKNAVQLRDRSGNIQTQFHHKGHVRGAEFSKSGDKVFTISENFFFVWDKSGAKLAEMEHPNAVHSYSISPDEKYVAIVDRSGIPYIWELSGKQVRSFTFGQDVCTYATFAPDGDIAIATTSNRIFFLKASQTKQADWQMDVDKESIVYLAFSPDGQLMLTVSMRDWRGWEGYARIWTRDGRLVYKVMYQQRDWFSAFPQFSVDGRILVLPGRKAMLLRLDQLLDAI
jgi:WD40 repeat protein